MERNTILIADDMKINRRILGNIFNEQYNILEAEDGQVTIDLLEEKGEEIAILFLDLSMPKKTGLDVLQFMKRKHLMEEIPVIMITGEATAETDKEAYDAGVSDIIYKPFEAIVVMRRAKNLIELFRHKSHLEEELDKRTREVKAQAAELEKSRKILQENNEFLGKALGSVAEYRSMETGPHLERVQYFTQVLLDHLSEMHPELKLDARKKAMIAQASRLHDIGKIGIPDAILQKGSKLDPEEYRIMKTHTTIGCEILDNFKQTENELYRITHDICLYHHERYDGTGYPEGLVGDKIPLAAQVVGLADQFDNLVSKKSYRLEYAAEEAARMINEGECGDFSPMLLEAFNAAKFQLTMATEENFVFSGNEPLEV